MKLHEYQANEIFKQYGIPIQEHVLITEPEETEKAARNLGCPIAVKAQVLTGGRGKAGGVKLADSPEEADRKARKIFGLTINNLKVEKILLTRALDIDKEFYLGLILDRTTRSVVLMLSAAGGVEIEELAETDPDQIVKFSMDRNKGTKDPALAGVLSKVFGEDHLADQASETLDKLYRLFLEKDCSIAEINPYASSGDALVALDSKIVIDDNSLFKHPDLEAMKNPEEYSADETDAKANGLSFVSLGGDIGCIVNGAGLAMATLDIIKLYGGNPANFLDVGGSSNPAKVLNALRIIVGNKKVKAILINIFGGITRCDDIANGIMMAMRDIDISVPMVIRLIGTNDKEGREILTSNGFTVADHLSAAVEKVVSVASQQKAATP